MLNSIGDASCRPAYVERLNAWLDAHADAARRGRAPQARDEPAAGVRREEPGTCARRSRTRRRSASRSATPAASTSTPCARYLDALRRAVHARPDARARPRLLHAHDLRVRRARRERELDDLRRRPLRRARRGDRRPADARASASAPGSSGSLLALENEGVAVAPPAARRLLRRRRRRTARRVLAAARRAAAGGHRRRHRLRRPLVQGPDDPGRPDRRAHGRDRPAPTARPSARGGRRAAWSRSTTSSLRSSPMSSGATYRGSTLATERRGPHGRRSPAGSRAGATTAGSIFVDLRDEERRRPGRDQPGARARGRRDRARAAQRVRGPARAATSSAARPRPSTRAWRRARSRCRPSELEILSRSTPLPVPARRGGRRRDAAHPLPLARPAPRRRCSGTSGRARSSSRSSAQEMEARRLRRHRDADHGQADARGRARLPRSRRACSPGASSRCRRARRSTSSCS